MNKLRLEFPGTPRRHIGRRLRRFRRLRGLNQDVLAELLGVSQGVVARWEAGTLAPGSEKLIQIEHLVAAKPDSKFDRALRRLVETASIPVHLVCDCSHVLLAASAARQMEWRADVSLIGSSLWKFATESIVRAEEELASDGWFDAALPNTKIVTTGANDSGEVVIPPSTFEWEQVNLSDGSTARLVTTLAVLRPCANILT